MQNEADIVIIGAGVVGLAIAGRVAKPGRSVYVLEKNARHGLEQSSRNAQTIHAGILYEDGIKADLCIEGCRDIYALSEKYGVPTVKCGKLCIAIDDAQQEVLERSYEKGLARGVPLQMLTQAEIRGIEPELRVQAAFHSPNSGVMDVLGLMGYLLTDAQARGVQLVGNNEVTGIEPLAGGYRVHVRDASGQPSSITAGIVINSAGLFSDKVAEMAGIDIDEAGYREIWIKGIFYSVLNGRNKRINTLIYPIPLPASIDMHVCLDPDWRLRIGPHCYPTEQLDYAVDDSRRDVFLNSTIMRALPFIRPEDIEPEGSGILVKLAAAQDKNLDFIIRHEAERGLPGLINLIGMGSPALTAATAIGRHVAEMVDGII